MEQILYEVKKTIVGQDALLERLLVALLARGHILVEGVPGLAKTLAVKSLAGAIGGQFHRVQFTPDLVPADIVGTRIYHQGSGEFQVSLGPVFTNLLLADEINRAPAKVQSALLEVMQEQQVTIGRETHPVPRPFLVMATQNPIESEGTYPLPEAQVDRFMMKVVVDYPSPTEEFVIVERAISPAPAGPGHRRRSTSSNAMQAQVEQVYVDPALIEYAVRLANATRRPDEVGLAKLARYVTFGASPRASINLVLAARALAFIRGRDYAVPQDLTDLALDVFRHRLVLSYEALTDDVTADAVLSRVLGGVARTGRPTAAEAAGPVTTAARPAAAAAGMAGPPPTRRAAAGRVPHGVPRHRDRLHRPARRTPRRTTSGTSTGTSPPGWTSRYVRQYTEDRELTAWLVLDQSASMRFGGGPHGKDSVLAELAICLGRLFTQGGNRVGAILYDNAPAAGDPAADRPQPHPASHPLNSPVPTAVERGRADHRPGRDAAPGRLHGPPAQPGLRHLRLHRRGRLGAGPDAG